MSIFGIILYNKNMENLDLSNKKWVISQEFQLDIISKSLEENYSVESVNEVMEASGLTIEDLLDQKKLVSLLEILNQKYPE